MLSLSEATQIAKFLRDTQPSNIAGEDLLRAAQLHNIPVDWEGTEHAIEAPSSYQSDPRLPNLFDVKAMTDRACDSNTPLSERLRIIAALEWHPNTATCIAARFQSAVLESADYVTQSEQGEVA